MSRPSGIPDKCGQADALFLRALAALIAVSGLVSLLLNWSRIFETRSRSVFGSRGDVPEGSDWVIIGGTSLVIFVVALYLVIHTLLIRAGDIRLKRLARFSRRAAKVG